MVQVGRDLLMAHVHCWVSSDSQYEMEEKEIPPPSWIVHCRVHNLQLGVSFLSQMDPAQTLISSLNKIHLTLSRYLRLHLPNYFIPSLSG
jgi:hypothetical protein